MNFINILEHSNEGYHPKNFECTEHYITGYRPERSTGPTIFFDYPPQCWWSRDTESSFQMKAWGKYRVGPNTNAPVTLLNTLSYNGFEKVNTNDVKLYWTFQVNAREIQSLNCGTFVNHFPGNDILGKKNLLHWVINSKILSPEQEITPKTWVLPEDADLFKAAWTEMNSYFIV